MSSKTKMLVEAGLIKPPRFLADNVVYETITGSVAYGVSDDNSDMDIYGIAIPTKEILFPSYYGHILNFSSNIPKFDQYQQHHIINPSELKGKGRQYDLTIFSIVKFFRLALDCNPNCVDVLYTPHECVLHSTNVGNLIRENRKLFLHKGLYVKFKSYSYSQLCKMSSKNRDPNGKRYQDFITYGYDRKFSTHVVRLLLECEQLLTLQDMDLRRDREQLKSIRRGEWTEQEIRDWASEKEKDLEKMYVDSPLPNEPNEKKVKQLLINCLEEHYGNLSNCIVQPDAAVTVLKDIQKILDSNQQLFN